MPTKVEDNFSTNNYSEAARQCSYSMLDIGNITDTSTIHCTNKCPEACKGTNYEFQVETSPYYEDKAGVFSMLQIRPKEMELITKEEIYMYSFTTFISNIGGHNWDGVLPHSVDKTQNA